MLQSTSTISGISIYHAQKSEIVSWLYHISGSKYENVCERSIGARAPSVSKLSKLSVTRSHNGYYARSNDDA